MSIPIQFSKRLSPLLNCCFKVNGNGMNYSATFLTKIYLCSFSLFSSDFNAPSAISGRLFTSVLTTVCKLLVEI